MNIHQDTLSGMYPGTYTVSGLDTEQTPATMKWKVVPEPISHTATDITPAENCAPYLI